MKRKRKQEKSEDDSRNAYIVTNTVEGTGWYIRTNSLKSAKESVAATQGYDINTLKGRPTTLREDYLQKIVPDIIKNYRKEAARFQRRFNTLQITTIVLSSLVSGIGWFVDRWVISLLGIAITIVTGISLHFKYREKYYNLRQTADQMEAEHNAFKLNIGLYGDEEEDETALFIKKFEYLREEQQKRQLQLEQSSHSDSLTARDQKSFKPSE